MYKGVHASLDLSLLFEIAVKDFKAAIKFNIKW